MEHLPRTSRMARPGTSPGTLHERTPAPVDRSVAGTVLGGRYRIGECIGAGAMGVVWTAWDRRLRRTVAVKQLSATGGDDPVEARAARARAMREGRIAARVVHPRAIAVFDVVVAPAEGGPVPWLVMEYLPSRSLAAVLAERGPLEPAEVVRIGAQIADALSAVHEAGIVHGDVKPGNVLLTDDGVAKLTDFGVSRASWDSTNTGGGMVAGTPGYFAPEVARGSEPSPASDVFSLGATLYAAVENELVCGRLDNTLAVLHAMAEGRLRPATRAGMLGRPLAAMLRMDPTHRPDATAVHRYLDQRVRSGGAGRPVAVSRGSGVAGGVAAPGGSGAGGAGASRAPLTAGAAPAPGAGPNAGGEAAAAGDAAGTGAAPGPDTAPGNTTATGGAGAGAAAVAASGAGRPPQGDHGSDAAAGEPSADDGAGPRLVDTWSRSGGAGPATAPAAAGELWDTEDHQDGADDQDGADGPPPDWVAAFFPGAADPSPAAGAVPAPRAGSARPAARAASPVAVGSALPRQRTADGRRRRRLAAVAAASAVVLSAGVGAAVAAVGQSSRIAEPARPSLSVQAPEPTGRATKDASTTPSEPTSTSTEPPVVAPPLSPGPEGSTTTAPPTTSAGPDTPVTAEDVRSTVSDYYGALPGDLDGAWAVLSEDARDASGGYDGYRRFWSGIQSVTASDVQVDGTSARATLEFRTTGGRTSRESYRFEVDRAADGRLEIRSAQRGADSA